MHVNNGTPPGKAAPDSSEWTPKGKAAGMLDTSKAASKQQCPASLSANEKLTKADQKRLANLCARAAMHGATFGVSTADDGSPLFTVQRWVLTRTLGNLDAAERWLDCLVGDAK